MTEEQPIQGVPTGEESSDETSSAVLAKRVEALEHTVGENCKALRDLKQLVSDKVVAIESRVEGMERNSRQKNIRVRGLPSSLLTPQYDGGNAARLREFFVLFNRILVDGLKMSAAEATGIISAVEHAHILGNQFMVSLPRKHKDVIFNKKSNLHASGFSLGEGKVFLDHDRTQMQMSEDRVIGQWVTAGRVVFPEQSVKRKGRADVVVDAEQMSLKAFITKVKGAGGGAGLTEPADNAGPSGSGGRGRGGGAWRGGRGAGRGDRGKGLGKGKRGADAVPGGSSRAKVSK